MNIRIKEWKDWWINNINDQLQSKEYKRIDINEWIKMTEDRLLNINDWI